MMARSQSIIGKRECPEGLTLEYTLDGYGKLSNVLRVAYKGGEEMTWARGSIYGPVEDEDAFKSLMDVDRLDFLRKHWHRSMPVAEA